MHSWFALLASWNWCNIGHQAYSNKISSMKKKVPYKRAKKKKRVKYNCAVWQNAFFFFRYLHCCGQLSALMTSLEMCDWWWFLSLLKSEFLFFLHIYIYFLLKYSWRTMYRCTARWFNYTYTRVSMFIIFHYTLSRHIDYSSVNLGDFLFICVFFFFLLRNLAFYPY